MTLSEQIQKVALKSGLDLVGIAPAEPFEGYHWKDSIMRDPRLTMPEAQSLVIVGASDLKSIKKSQIQGLIGKISRSYAAGHEFNLYDELMPIKKLLTDAGYQVHISPNTLAASTIPMKLAAVRAGLGFQGKHSVVITPEYGSWVTFGALMTDALLDYNKPLSKDICGKCTACIDACPMKAINAPYIVEMPACAEEIANSSGDIPDSIKEKMGNTILSCDVCLEACPHSKKILKKSQLNGETPYEYNLLELLNLNKAEFSHKFKNLNWSIDLVSFKRNVIIALGNSGDKSAVKELEKYVSHENNILKKTTQWALNTIHNKNS